MVEFIAEGGHRHAALWRGTAASFELLSPDGSVESVAVATDGVHQYGWASFPDRGRAMMWSGNAHSAVSLDPMRPGTAATSINGAVAERQAGSVAYTNFTLHAAMWTGTAASMVDINPPGWAYSEALGACATAVVGWGNPAGADQKPGIWLGPGFAFQELPMPEGHFFGKATSVTFYNGQYYIGGFVTTSFGGQPHAVLWTGVPAPGAGVVVVMGAALAGRRRRGEMAKSQIAK